LNPSGNPAAGEKTWKRVAKLALWLYVMTPIGLWKLWHDPVLSASAKWRILIYLFVIPGLAYAAVSVWMVNSSVQRLLP
jgi:hypothetical protein